MPSYQLPPDYVRRHRPAYWETAKEVVVSQPDVYVTAGRIARAVGASRIVDVGCGGADKLLPLHPEFEVVGVDVGVNLAGAKTALPSATWIEHDLDSPGPLPVDAATLSGAVVICADVIEHMVHPERLLEKLRLALGSASALVLSTPERELSRGPDHRGPSPHRFHSMEWALRELDALLGEHGFDHREVGLTRDQLESSQAQNIAVLAAPDAETLSVANEAAGWLRPSLPPRLDVAPVGVLPFSTPGRLARRICLISREYHEDTWLGGVGRLVNMQAPALAAAGATVHVITLSPDGGRHDYVRDGLHVHRIPTPRAWGAKDMTYVHMGAWARAVADRFQELDREWHFDVVDVPDFYGEGLHLELSPRTGKVVTLHSLTELVVRHLYDDAPTPGALGWHALELAALQRAHMVIAPTEFVHQQSFALLGEQRPPVKLLPHAFDASRFPERPARTEVPARLRLAFIGRVERRKGPDLAVRAAAALAARGRDVELLMVGRDWLHYREDVLEPLCAELGFHGVRYTGNLDEAGVAAELGAADCALMPSRWDNFHTSAVEAIASGVPVITSDWDGLAGWLGRDEGLAAIPIGDPARFAELAADTLLDEDWLLRSAPRGAARIRDLFAPERIGRELLDAYDEMLESRRAGEAVLREAELRRAGDRRSRAREQGRRAERDLATRAQTVLAYADELVERPDLAGAWARHIGEGDDVTLVAVTASPAEQAGALLLEVLEAVGATADGGPDVLLHAAVRDDGEALEARAVAVLTEREDLPVTLDRLPRFGVADVAGVRDLVG